MQVTVVLLQANYLPASVDELGVLSQFAAMNAARLARGGQPVRLVALETLVDGNVYGALIGVTLADHFIELTVVFEGEVKLPCVGYHVEFAPSGVRGAVSVVAAPPGGTLAPNCVLEYYVEKGERVEPEPRQETPVELVRVYTSCAPDYVREFFEKNTLVAKLLAAKEHGGKFDLVGFPTTAEIENFDDGQLLVGHVWDAEFGETFAQYWVLPRLNKASLNYARGFSLAPPYVMHYLTVTPTRYVLHVGKAQQGDIAVLRT